MRESGGPGSLPLWHAAHPSVIGMGEHSWARYEATGGTCRPLADTVADVLAQERQLGIGRELVSELTRDAELALIAAARG